MNINFLAVLVAALASYFLGILWYSPLLFGGLWLKLCAVDKKKLKKEKAKGTGRMYIISLLSNLVRSYVLAYVIVLAGITSLAAGLQLSFWLWLGFSATLTLGGVIWESRSIQLFILNNTYNLTALMIASSILISWK